MFYNGLSILLTTEHTIADILPSLAAFSSPQRPPFQIYITK